MDGFLIDLDGTMYDPSGLLPGAREFYAWLLATGKQFVFLSNTGAKSARHSRIRKILHQRAIVSPRPPAASSSRHPSPQPAASPHPAGPRTRAQLAK